MYSAFLMHSLTLFYSIYLYTISFTDDDDHPLTAIETALVTAPRYP